MKKAREKMQMRLRILATIILVFVGLAALTGGEVTGKIAVGSVLAVLVVPGTIKEEDVELYKTFIEGAKKEFSTVLDEKINGMLTEAEFQKRIDKIKSDFETYTKDIGKIKEFADLVDKVKEQGILITKIQDNGGMLPTKSFKEELRKSLTDNREKIIEAVGKKQGYKLELKAASAIISTTNIGAGVVQGYREAGVNREPVKQLWVRQLINTIFGGPGSDPITWIEKRPKGVGVATPVSESGAKPLIDFEFVEGKISSETIAAVIYVTKQAVTNMTLLQNEIEVELMKAVNEVFDWQLLYGDGSTPNLKGIKTYATAFSAGSLAGTIASANYFDALRAAILQVRNGRFVPNTIIVSHDAAAMLDLAKDDNGRYVMPPFSTPDGTVIKGIMIREAELDDPDEFFVLDSNVCLINIVEDLIVEIGWVNDQFIKNQYTIRAELQAAHRVKYHDTPGIVYGLFSDAISALNKIEG